jgi:DNA-directed RNA polymerase sigma subunit (sigma70/sigma32)
MSKFSITDDLFQIFVKEMNQILKKDEDKKQNKTLLNELISLERKFKKLLLSSSHGAKVYVDFMSFILDEEDGKGNMLAARVYFRERQDTFSKKMYKAFHSNNPKMLHKFKINYKFCVWALKIYKGPNTRALKTILNKMIPIRKEICEQNLPLVLNRSRIFHTNTPRSHNSYMDINQSASEGLMIAVDKFVPESGRVKNNRDFNGVAIGKMSLEMRDTLSQTLVKLPPKEKRILYRARKAEQSNTNMSAAQVATYVSESFKGTSSEDIERIEAAAAGIKSMDEKLNGHYTLAEMYPDDAIPLDEALQNNQLQSIITDMISKFSVIEKKLILMKFGEIYGIKLK